MSRARAARPRRAAAKAGRATARRRSAARTPDIVGRYTPLGYRAVSVARREGRTALAGNADYHAKYDRKDLIRMSRAFWRDNGLYRGLIDVAVTNIVRGGFSLQARTKSKSWNERSEALFKEWARRPEARGLQTWRRVQQMLMRELLVAGDIAALKLGGQDKDGRPIAKDGLLQLIESERIVSSANAFGVQVDSEGAITKFLVSDYDKDGQLKSTSKPAEYSADQVLYLAALDQPSQTRGLPVCQSSFSQLHRINDTCDSEALARQMISRLAFAIVRSKASEIGYATSKQDDSKSSADAEGDLSTRLHELDYALIAHLEPGEEIKGIERNIPGPGFSETLRTFLRLLGLPLGLPLELVLRDWSQTNYSSARAALEQAFATFEDYQLLLEDSIHQPLYRWLVERWVAEGKLAPREDMYAHEWIRPSFPWLDQLKECQAWGAKLDRGLSLYATATKSLNHDPGELKDGRQKEIEDAIERSRQIEAKYPGAIVPWELFAGLRPANAATADAVAPSGEKRAPKQPADDAGDSTDSEDNSDE